MSNYLTTSDKIVLTVAGSGLAPTNCVSNVDSPYCLLGPSNTGTNLQFKISSPTGKPFPIITDNEYKKVVVSGQGSNYDGWFLSLIDNINKYLVNIY